MAHLGCKEWKHGRTLRMTEHLASPHRVTRCCRLEAQLRHLRLEHRTVRARSAPTGCLLLDHQKLSFVRPPAVRLYAQSFHLYRCSDFHGPTRKIGRFIIERTVDRRSAGDTTASRRFHVRYGNDRYRPIATCWFDCKLMAVKSRQLAQLQSPRGYCPNEQQALPRKP